ncbi:tRNA dimethylallyltransferase [Candidatus Tachikawaea gelatinosa]|uniref:tRNA dimethylallyltransferase n=2 Tax=Candidatus Tachikawaea gelatinosa TaxID=1410383 RepID=A0A090AIS0_9ENTR|nr:tRNA (adenosine(37)-N6)-dimethylallyltransferase MiaA [Candidatus Tachikawaea gelatinosa]BAP58298.1 tRNA dimethylallyltransferase [Candidatus Tachikawaea gelatinosa]
MHKKQLIKPKAIFLMGPTASGKTKLAIMLKKKLPLEIISVDSGLVYKGMDIGTNKPSKKELKIAPHFLVDVCNPKKNYSVADFYFDACAAMNSITKRGNIPLLVGGTMFYFKTLLNGLPKLPSSNFQLRNQIKKKYSNNLIYLHSKLSKIDPIASNRIHPNDIQRVLRALEIFYLSGGKTLTSLTKKNNHSLPYDFYQFVIYPSDKEKLNKLISLRFKKMLDLGLEEEVKKFYIKKDMNKDLSSMRTLGYREMWSYLSGEISYDNMIIKAVNNTKKLAKKQMTWLRQWKNIYWLNHEKKSIALNQIQQIFFFNKN